MPPWMEMAGGSTRDSTQTQLFELILTDFQTFTFRLILSDLYFQACTFRFILSDLYFRLTLSDLYLYVFAYLQIIYKLVKLA